MSDSLVFCNKLLSRGQVDFPRYIDLKKKAQEKPEPQEDLTEAKVLSKFERLCKR